MHSRSDLEIKVRLVLGLIVLSGVMILLLRLLLPILAIAGFIAGGYWLWQQYRNQQQRYQRQQARIHAQFYQLLRQQQGRISVLDFAMRTRLSGADAQDYLNTQAQAFSAFFETTPTGDLIYVFNSTYADRASDRASWAQTYQNQAYQNRAYREHAEAERAYAQQTQTAWTNAKQIRTLRQLSQQGKTDIIREHIAEVVTPPKRLEPGGAVSSQRHRSSKPSPAKPPVSDSSAKRAAAQFADEQYIDIDIEQTEIERAQVHPYADSRTIDVTVVRS